MSKTPAIIFENVSKAYPASPLAQGGFKEFLLHLPRHLHSMVAAKKVQALTDVSFNVNKGECFGVIGRNGSGKSTTLGLIAGVIRPSTGHIRTHGRIAPLLELGAGFHRDLSGAENVLLNGVLLGLLKREVRQRYDEIIAFAEIGDAIRRPLRTYSSGMLARLGFAVAVHLYPDILLVDEVLAVGDQAFREKCHDKIRSFRKQGVTIALVSHDIDKVALLCDNAVLLNHGQVVTHGPADAVAHHYDTMLKEMTRAGLRDAKSLNVA